MHHPSLRAYKLCIISSIVLGGYYRISTYERIILTFDVPHSSGSLKEKSEQLNLGNLYLDVHNTYVTNIMFIRN